MSWDAWTLVLTGLLCLWIAWLVVAQHLRWRKLPRITSPQTGDIVVHSGGTLYRIIGPRYSEVTGDVIGWTLTDHYGYRHAAPPDLCGYRKADRG